MGVPFGQWHGILIELIILLLGCDVVCTAGRERATDNDLVGTPQRLAATWTRPQPKCFIYCNLTQIPRLQIAFGAKVQQAASGRQQAAGLCSVSASATVLV